MNYRTAELFNDTGMAATGTEIIAIDVQNPISQLVIQQRSVGSSSTPTAHLAACLPKVEIVDGSDRLFSLAAYELDAFDFYHRKKVPFGINTYLTGVQGIKTYIINFGRYLWDPELAFDPKRFKNPQLRITYDRAAGGSVSNALEIQVVAKIFDEKSVSPVGFLMHKEIKRYAIGAGTWEDTDLPTDYPYRMLLMSARAPGKHPHGQFREIKLSEDVDKKIPFHFDTTNLIKWMQTEYPQYVENFYGPGDGNAKTYYITPAFAAVFAGVGNQAMNIFQAAGLAQGGTLVLTGSAGGNITGQVMGYCPHGSVCVPFGLQDQIDDWYDVSQIGKLKLHIKGHASRTAGDLQICLQQFRRY